MNKITVEAGSGSLRLDAFLAEFHPGLSRSQAQKIIRESLVNLNGKKVMKAAHKLHVGDVVTFSVPEKQSSLSLEKMPLDILYEDKDILAINKPIGLVVHPTSATVGKVTTLVNGLLAYLGKDFLQVGNALRPGIVHRLDKDTSGVMLIARTQLAYLALVKLFAKRQIKKTYLALVSGKLRHKKATIDAPLDNFFAGKKMQVSQHGKNAVTHYHVLQQFEDCSLVEIDLETGRTHQIRVHFAAIGHPVIGDQTYGSKKINDLYQDKCGLTRQFLHAYKLKFIHPFTQKELLIEAPLLTDLQLVLDYLRR